MRAAAKEWRSRHEQQQARWKEREERGAIEWRAMRTRSGAREKDVIRDEEKITLRCAVMR